MKNKILLALLGLGLCLPLASLKGGASEVRAEGEHGAEEAAESYWIDQLPGFVGTQWIASQSSDGTVNYASNVGQHCFNYVFSNVEVNGNYRFSGTNWNYWFSINVGATYGDMSNPLTTKGYGFVFDPYGGVNLKKNDVSLTTASNPTFTINTTDVFKYTVRSRNCGDGAVHLEAFVNNTLLLDYYDTDSPITSGSVGGENFYFPHTISGQDSHEEVNLPDVDYPMSGADVPVSSIADCGYTITTNAATGSGFSGVGYKYHPTTSDYSYKVKVTPLSDTTIFAMQIGAINGAINKYNNVICTPTTIDATYGWERGGYVVWLLETGQLLLSTQWYNSQVIATSWISPLAKDVTHEFEIRVTALDSYDIISLKVDGAVVWKYFDSTYKLSIVSGTEYINSVLAQSREVRFNFGFDYNAEIFAQDLLDQTDNVCKNFDKDNEKYDEFKTAFEGIWSNLDSNDKYRSLTSVQKSLLAKAERVEDGTVLEQAMARYDFLTGKYALTNFIDGRSRVTISSLLAFETSTVDAKSSTLVIVIAALASITMIGTLLVIKKRKHQ